MMFEGRCPKCGSRYSGWALRHPRHQTCPKCGIGLVIKDNKGKVIEGYSPFTVDQHIVKLPEDTAPHEPDDSTNKMNNE